jgi:predicted DNA-binding transcriptional regulator AlpA|tara:strand:+ start:316 stop:501 length:186 start_codon:yes stop_codon:yes gene_type:complete
MKLITFDELRNKLGGRARSSIYLDLEHARLPTPLKLGGRLYWEEDQINKWIKERLRQGQKP